MPARTAEAASSSTAQASFGNPGLAGEPQAREKRPWGRHPIDLRASVPLPGGRWYVTILAGRERRGAERLRAEGQLGWVRRGAVYLIMLSVALWLTACIVVALYILKSILGIDLWDGASPLHFIYELLLEGAPT